MTSKSRSKTLSRPNEHEITVVVGGANPLARTLAPHSPELPEVELTLRLRGDESLRHPVLRAAEPHLRSWFEAAGIPPAAFSPTILASEGEHEVELGQGFVVGSDGLARATFDLAG